MAEKHGFSLFDDEERARILHDFRKALACNVTLDSPLAQVYVHPTPKINIELINAVSLHPYFDYLGKL